MKKLHVLTTAIAAAAFLAGCGGNEAGDQSPRVAFSSMVSFGDSLSDVGSYDVGFVAAYGGGHYSINGTTSVPRTNWTEFLADTMQVAQPCAALTGLNSTGTLAAYAVAETWHDASNGGTCTNYAEGGSRVANPDGPGHDTDLGQLTYPVVTQITDYLGHYGAFTSNQLVTVFAGGNDVFANVTAFETEVATLMGQGEDQATATTTAATDAVTAMATAGGTLAAYINQLILANGATHVVVVNLPDVSLTPYAIAAGTSAQTLVNQMTVAFNTYLQAGLAGADSSKLVYVDAYTTSQDQAANKAQYGLANVTDTACDLDATVNPLQSSLICTPNNLITGLTAAVATTSGTAYEYADSVHPTPYGYRLLAELVAKDLAIKGWL